MDKVDKDRAKQLLTRDLCALFLTTVYFSLGQMSLLTFSRIVSTCRLVSTLEKSFHPFSSTHHSHIYSISAMPDIPDKTEVERDEESQWSDKVQHAMAGIESRAQLNSYSGTVVLSAI